MFLLGEGYKIVFEIGNQDTGGVFLDCNKAGELLSCLRKEKNMTQRKLAEILNISDKTVSKWERGLGLPDVSLLKELSNTLGVNIDRILEGDLSANEVKGGNMKRLKFYVCPDCDNMMTSTGNAELSCCGRKMEALKVKERDEIHEISIQEIENDYYITMDHDMKKSHYISFMALVSYDKLLLSKLYPEQNPEVRFPRINGTKLYSYCSEHGLFEYNLRSELKKMY